LMVLRLADENPSWGIARISSEAVVSRHSAWIALHRHRPGRVNTTTCITTDDVMIDLDAREAEYAAAVAAGMFYDDTIEAIEDPVIVMQPAAAVIKATEPEPVVTEYSW